MGCSLGANGQHVKLDRCEPASIQPGVPSEIRLHGGGLERCELWTSFPAKVERVDEKNPRFRITTEHVGPGAIRAHSGNGVSNLAYLLVEAAGKTLVPSENKTRREEAQRVEIPTVVHGASPNLASHFYLFSAGKGEELTIQAESRGSDFDGVLTLRTGDGKRLAQADDSAIDGADPRIDFVAPAKGEYLVEVSDSQYRGGKAYRFSLKQAEEEELFQVEQPDVVDFAALESPDPLGLGKSCFVYQDVLEASSGVDTFRFGLKSRRFVTVTPATRALRSAVKPRIRVANAAGKVVVETPADTFDERVLQGWLDPGEGYQLMVSDAFGRQGEACRYRVTMDFGVPPFNLSVPGQTDKKHPLQDKFIAVPGGVFVIPVQCHRHQFPPAIDLCLESSVACGSGNLVLAENQGSANVRVRLPADSKPGTLIDLRVSGTAEMDGREYEAVLSTKRILSDRDRGVEVPGDVDGLLAVRVMERPFEIEVNPPPEMTKGTTVKVPVKLVWPEGKRRFNTKVRINGLPGGVQCGEKGLNDKTDSLELELKVDNPGEIELADLVVEVEMDFHRQQILVESASFTVKLKEKDEKK